MNYRSICVTILIGCVLQRIGAIAQERLYPNEFPLGDVMLLDGPFKRARDLNIENLLKYKVDRLLAPYRREAGLEPKDSGYRNWEGLDGHIGGHYLSALAINAATGDRQCRSRMLYMIRELKACQAANTEHHPGWGVGYVGGVPHSELVWLSVKNGDFNAFHSAWVPWYNVHKLFAGLRDAWAYAGNVEAREIFLRFCDWAVNITAGLSDDQMQAMLDTEQGGMNEVLADAYAMTGDRKYILAAQRFSHRMLLTPMSEGIDNLDNKHANTQIPKAIGFSRIGELTGQLGYEKAGRFFWETVTQNRTLALGGNGRREFFPSAAACTDFINDVEGPESCNSYNMLKLTEDLFRMHPSARYADFYERAVYNHILSTQDPVTGGYVYFTPVRPESYRVYSAANAAMWCCVGSGMENHGKYNAFIYTHRDDTLFVNLFVASELNWVKKGIGFRQETRFPYAERTKLSVTNGDASFRLAIRYPAWVAQGALRIRVNGKPFVYERHPSSYVTIARRWKKGDVVEVELPMHNTIEHLPNAPNYIAFMHGPVLLGAITGEEDLKGLIADDSRWGHIPSGEKFALDKMPVLLSDDLDRLADSLVPVKGGPLHFMFSSVRMLNGRPLTLQPFYTIHRARYMMYWMVLGGVQYRQYLDSLSTLEVKRQALDEHTVDRVAPGEQQPEVDHDLQSERSRTGTNQDRMFREANGYFSYRLATRGKMGLSLLVRYWGAEWGSRRFAIYVDDQQLATVDNTGKWNQSQFFDVAYPIPYSLVSGKSAIRIKFAASPGGSAGPVYDIRLLGRYAGSP